jgi:rod shape-determining protein MreC
MAERSQKEVWRMTPWLVIALLLGNFLLMAFDARVSTGQSYLRVWTQTVADFVQSPITTVTSGISNYFASFANMRSAESENSILQTRVQELEVELKSREDLVAENERLRKLLELKDESKSKVLTARIIGRDPSIWFDSSILNRGSLDGVKLNMPVITNGGIVGRVTAVGPLTSQVDLITHDKSGVGAVVGEISPSNALGVVVGSSKRDTLEMRYVSGSIDVQVGQAVYTTGQDGIYPPGLKVGTIIQVEPGSASQPHKIIIEPSSGLGSMQEVGILFYEPPPKPQFDKSVPNALKEKKK